MYENHKLILEKIVTNDIEKAIYSDMVYRINEKNQRKRRILVISYTQIILFYPEKMKMNRTYFI